MFWQLVFIVTAIWALYYRWKKRRIYKFCKEVPSCGLPELPILGQAHLFAGSDEDRMNILQKLGRISVKQGGISSVWMANKLYVTISDPATAEVVLKSCLDKDDTTMKYLRSALGNGSVFAPVNIWRPRRKILAPIFSLKNLYCFVPVFAKQSAIMVQHLEKEAGKGDFSFWKYMTTYTFDAICNSEQEEMRSFLEMMIESSGGAKGYTELELREEVLVIILAGTDTSAVGAAYTALMLSRYPEVQEKVYQELQDVFGDTDRPITVQDLPRLKYLEAVIKETLRIYPAVPVIVREVLNDVELPSGITLVNGVGILMHFWAMHRDPKYWGDDAEQFRPERFLEGPLKHPSQYMPFSYSMRNCVGSTYAMMSMKTIISTLVRRYRLLPPSELQPHQWTEPLRVKWDVMMKHVDNYIMRIEDRKEVNTAFYN